jgi:hypothetical protein
MQSLSRSKFVGPQRKILGPNRIPKYFTTLLQTPLASSLASTSRLNHAPAAFWATRSSSTQSTGVERGSAAPPNVASSVPRRQPLQTATYSRINMLTIVLSFNQHPSRIGRVGWPMLMSPKSLILSCMGDQPSKSYALAPSTTNRIVRVESRTEIHWSTLRCARDLLKNRFVTGFFRGFVYVLKDVFPDAKC